MHKSVHVFSWLFTIALAAWIVYRVGGEGWAAFAYLLGGIFALRLGFRYLAKKIE